MVNDVVVKPRVLLRDPVLWKACLYLPLSFALGVAWFFLLAIGVPISTATLVVWVGLVGWALLVVLLRYTSVLDRRLISLVYGVEIPSPYRRVADLGLLARCWEIAKDPATWKDLAFQVIRIPLSFGYFLGTVVSGAFVGFCLFMPVIALVVTKPGDAPEFFGHRITEWWQGVPFTLAGLPLLLALLYVYRALAELHLLLAVLLLGPSEKQALRARTAQLKASRARGVDAAETERRRIERDLHDGAQQQLLGVVLDIGRARAKLDADPEGARALIEQAHTGARAAIGELRDLARGIYPAILTDRGLSAALSALAARSPVPVRIEVDLADRPPAVVETIAYFTVAEALTNIAKYAEAGNAAVTVFRSGGEVTVEVRDDGRGGARLVAGGGLAGLADRAATIDGSLAVDSPEGGPTVVRAVLPCTW